jgi:hypothetical protein
MGPIKAEIPSLPPFDFIGDRLHEGHDCRILGSGSVEELEYLIFMDSRGVSSRYENSLADKIIHHISEKGSYLLVCRPLELTTWATLLNFLKWNRIAPKTIVTNMGFVDFTPKKEEVLLDAKAQVDYLLGINDTTIEFEEMYTASSGIQIPLYSLTYDHRYLKEINRIALNSNLVVLNTPAILPDLVLPRARPLSFFNGIEKGNDFNRRIENSTVLELPTFDLSLTYDAVHYTDEGNRLIFQMISKLI